MSTMQSPSTARDTCLSEDVVLAFQCGETTESERQRIHRHIDGCDNCRALLVMTAAMDGESGPAHVELDSMERLAAIVGSGMRLTTFAEGKLLAHRFEVTRFVERGGMGEVYEAFDRGVGSRVALKALLCTTPDDAPGASRLGEEVKLARRVAHRNVCRIYDLHEHREPGHAPLRFLAMEFVDGLTLKEHLLARELSIEEACAVARLLLEGLGAVHAAGVLHLDFKSQNVMLRQGARPEQPVVMDFSLSRAFEKELRLRTSERRVAGSIGYMSPEQLECQPTIGPAADVYAFGVVFYEMLTGRMPFAGDSPAAIMLKQLKSKISPPSSLRPGVTPSLDDFVLTCLHRHSRARYQNVAQAIQALDRCMSAVPSRRRWRPTPVLKMLAVALLAGGVMGSLVHLTSRAASSDAAPAESASLPARPSPTGSAPARDEAAAAPMPPLIFATPVEKTALPVMRSGRGGNDGIMTTRPMRPRRPPAKGGAASGSPPSSRAEGGPEAAASRAAPPPPPGTTPSLVPAPAATPDRQAPPDPASSAPRDAQPPWVPSSAPNFLL